MRESGHMVVKTSSLVTTAGSDDDAPSMLRAVFGSAMESVSDKTPTFGPTSGTATLWLEIAGSNMGNSERGMMFGSWAVVRVRLPITAIEVWRWSNPISPE